MHAIAVLSDYPTNMPKLIPQHTHPLVTRGGLECGLLSVEMNMRVPGGTM